MTIKSTGYKGLSSLILQKFEKMGLVTSGDCITYLTRALTLT
jgi:hypothetical protein